MSYEPVAWGGATIYRCKTCKTTRSTVIGIKDHAPTCSIVIELGPDFRVGEDKVRVNEVTGVVRVESPGPAPVDLSGLTKAELTRIARARGITVSAKMTKADLLAALS